MSYGQEKKKFPLAELGLYFEAEKKDQIDNASIDVKSAQWLRLRQRLLALPLPQFQTVIASMNALVDRVAPASETAAEDVATQQAQMLYDETSSRASQTQATTKVSAV